RSAAGGRIAPERDVRAVAAQTERVDVVEHRGRTGTQIDDRRFIAIRAGSALCSATPTPTPASATTTSAAAAVRADRVEEPATVAGELRIGRRARRSLVVAVQGAIAKLGAAVSAADIVRRPLPIRGQRAGAERLPFRVVGAREGRLRGDDRRP